MNFEYDLTIATVVFNARNDLSRTLESMAREKIFSSEYIVVDGGSIDGTLDVIKAYPKLIDSYISEPDKGIYDAMNKAVRLAKGRSILFLNAGDLLSSGAMPMLLAAAQSSADIVCHSIRVVNGVREIGIYQPTSPSTKGGHDPQHMYWPHPGIVSKVSVFKRIGFFDDRLRCSADLDWINRVISSKSIVVEYALNRPVVIFEAGGVSSSVLAATETRDVAIRHGKAKYSAYKRYLKLRFKYFLVKFFSPNEY